MTHKYTPAAAARKFVSDLTEEAEIIDALWIAKQTGNERSIAEARERVIFNSLEHVYQLVFEDTL